MGTTIGEKIKKLRKSEGLTQEELADNLNVCRQAVTKWECNVVIPSTDNLKLLCGYFKVDSNYFLNENYDDDETVTVDDTHKDKEAVNAENSLASADNQIKKTRGYLIAGAIIIIVISLALLIAIFFTIACGFIVFAKNFGHEKISLLSVERYTFYLFLILSLILFAIDLITVIYLKNRKK